MGIIVLIVDDDEGVRFFHKISVSQRNLSTDCLTFKNGQDAINYLNRRAQWKQYLPGIIRHKYARLTGWDFLDAIKNEHYSSRLYVVMVTSSVANADYERAKSYSMVMDLVEKPISPDEIEKIMSFPAIGQYF